MISFPALKLDFCPRCDSTLPQMDYDLQRCTACGWMHGERTPEQSRSGLSGETK